MCFILWDGQRRPILARHVVSVFHYRVCCGNAQIKRQQDPTPCREGLHDNDGCPEKKPEQHKEISYAVLMASLVFTIH